MEEILACRVCLATDIKLFDVYSNKLVSAFEMVTGKQITKTDGLPQKMCSYCSTMLLKNAAFKERCLSVQELLGYLSETEIITTDFFRIMDRTNFPSLHPYTIQSVLSLESTEQIKEEEIDYGDVDMGIDNDIKSEASDDDEPLSKKVTQSDNIKVKDEFDAAPEIDMIFLSKDQQIDELKKRMSSLNYMNSLYKCELCYKGFMTDVTYRNHMIRHDPQIGKYRCEICNIYCSTERTLKGHVATSHERKYICKQCNYITKSGSRAREHSRWHSGHTYECQLCGTSFAKSTSYLTHVRLRHPSKHCCTLCGESFIGQNGLNMHMKKAHSLQDSRSLPEQCKECGAKFYSEEALTRHSELNDCDINKRPCTQCGESFLSEEKLNEHFKLVHEATKCQECDKTFSSERSYAIHHQRMHLGLRPKRLGKRSERARLVVCELCGKACNRMHLGLRPKRLGKRSERARLVVCELCGKACNSKANLVHHQRTHTGEKPYVCKECPKRFGNFQLLQVHIRTHTGERPYKCDVCSKGFAHKAGLNRHVRVHTGEKPYACPHCDKAFSQSNSMKLHVNTVHLKMPAPYRGRKKEFTLSK